MIEWFTKDVGTTLYSKCGKYTLSTYINGYKLAKDNYKTEMYCEVYYKYMVNTKIYYVQ
jgi:hypothetical protein